MRAGPRYVESTRAHFGVTPEDARLNRAELLAMGSIPLNVNTVAQTSESTAQSKQADLAAFGTARGTPLGFSKSFSEHGLVMGLVSVRANLHYQQGVHRDWTRDSKYDFYWPDLAHLGEQEVYGREIFADPADWTGVFGWQERYAEYRYTPSRVTGQFRSNAAQPLHSWHLAQTFATKPVLGASFIEDKPPLQRVLAVQSPYPEFLVDCYFDFKAARPMPVYGTPGLRRL